ncbi:unnamed protein product [Leptidea sinapis]|uniref:V-SNARE coiled-coil homology domain-containing protein n=1 Tax=Leptidea sinapis TaxID=189913 RepID=A0A5E4PSJ0_9NEOP|nr:unnamed protein product [Leptidea sinapis]
MTAHADGALATWSTRSPRPCSLSYPHAKTNKDGKLEPCKPIQRLDWKTCRTGESLVIFSGGLAGDTAGRSHSITVLNGKSTTVLEMEHAVLDFEPYAIVVLLQHDLVVIDLQSPGYPCFENPYPMDIHESPVTCCSYFADCPSDLIPAFYSVGRQGHKKTAGFSEKLWPIDGGAWAPASCSYSEIILTGHTDGSVKFWDASAGSLQVLYKLKLFERRGSAGSGSGSVSGGDEESPLSVQAMALCAESRRLAVALPHGHCWRTGSLRVRGSAGTGGARRAAGFQPALVALQQGPPHPVTALTINSSYGLLAWGGERGVVVVDVWRRTVVAALPPQALYLPDPPAPVQPARHDRRSPELDQCVGRDCHQNVSIPLSLKLEEAQVSPDPAEEALPDPKLDHRRKSTSWKTFNLKRQLSKVDLKLKAAFGPADNDETNERSNSQFYCETERTVSAAESRNESPDGDDGKEKPKEDRSQLSSPLRVCSDVFERMHRELHEKRSSDVYDRMHKELQERWQDKERSEPSPDLSPSMLSEEEKAVRPDNLPLFDQDGKPTRPPRQKNKKKDETREQRLLSVPNIKYSKQESVKDLRRKQSQQQAQSFAGNLMRRFNKLDSSFSRSRSSSMSSLENISQEGIQCLAFADSYIKRSDPTALVPTLWIGTTLGSVLTMMISLPEADQRHTQAAAISTSGGPIFRLKGSILAMSFLDCNGALIPYSYEGWRDDCKDSRDRRDRTPTKQCSTGSGSHSSPVPEPGDRQFVVIASEKQARVVALPSQNCVYRQQIVDADFVVKAEIVSLKDSVCLVSYLSTGHLSAYSLPSLRPLLHTDFLPLSELSFQTQSKQRGLVDPMLSIWGQQLIVNEDTDQIAKTFCFSNRGHGLYLASPSEIQKFTIDAEFCQQLNEMMGELFLPRDMPEPPKESFFRGLFGGGARPLDREELFGESSGKPNRTVAKHFPAAEGLQARASTATGEIARAHQMAVERGDKLSQLEDKAERMHSQASEFSSSAHQLMLKYKDKKWYQLYINNEELSINDNNFVTILEITLIYLKI